MNTKKLLLSFGALAIILSSFTYKVFHGHEMIKLGAKAPMADEKMKDVSGDSFSLNDLKETNGLLVVFSCNTCPFVVGGVGDGWEGRYNDISQLSSESNIGMVLVNSNEAKREKGDSFNDMVERAKDKKFKSKYVIDNHSKLVLIKERLREAGVSNPTMRAEVNAYHIHHNVRHGDRVNRDCTVCHVDTASDLPAFDLAPFVFGEIYFS